MGKFDVMVVSDIAVEEAETEAPLTLFGLIHPRTGKEALYAVAGKESKELYEVQNLDSEEVIGSWTLGKDRVGGRTSLIITSRTDPIFIILPLLKSHAEAKGNVPLDDLISSQVPSNMTQYYDHLIPAFQARLSKVADSVGPPDLKVWKWNEGKVLTYLAKKSRALAKKLAHTTIQTDGTSSEILIKASNDKDRLRFAWEIISDNLDAVTSAALKDRLGIKDAPDPSKPPAKIAKTEPPTSLVTGEDGCSDYSGKAPLQPKKEVKLTAKQKQLEKGKVGTKSITSFFAKK